MITMQINPFAATIRLAGDRLLTRVDRRVWGFDPRWMRLEAFDESGDSLGLVWFEPVADQVDCVRAA